MRATIILAIAVTIIALTGVLSHEASAISSAVGHWTFNNGNTKVAHDFSGNGNNGKIIGAKVLDPSKCKTSYCLGFNGQTDLVSVPNSPSLNFGSNQNFSISLWMNTTQSGGGEPGYGLLVDHRRNNDGVYQGYSIEYNSGSVIGRIRDGSAHDAPVYSANLLNDGKFHLIVFVVDRTHHVEKLYVDNHLDSSTNISSIGNIDSQTNIDLGGMETPNTLVDFFKGTLDEVSIYNEALKPSQIHYLFTNGR